MRLDTARSGYRIGALRLCAGSLALALATAGPALAQRDDPGLQLNCANDFFRLCPGVDPQSTEADNCMNRNRARLSAECKAAISTFEAKPTKRAR